MYYQKEESISAYKFKDYSLFCVREQMQTRIPEMKTSIERLQERLDDMFFKDATPTSIRSTVSGESYAVHHKVPKSLTSNGIRKNKDKLKTVTNYRDNLSQNKEKKHIRFQTNAPSFNSLANSESNAASHSKAVLDKGRSSGARDKIGIVKQSNTGLTNLHAITNSRITSTRLSSEIGENTTLEARGFDHLELNKNHKESKMEVITDSHMDSRFKKKVVYARSENKESILVEPRIRNMELADKSELHAPICETLKANERISKESYLSESSVSKETEDLLRFDSREAEEPSPFSNSGPPHHNTHTTYSAITPVIRTDTIEKQMHSSNTPHNTKETYSLFTPVIRSDTLKSVSSSSKLPRHRSRCSPKLLSNIVYNHEIPNPSQTFRESGSVKASPESNHSKVTLGGRDIACGKNAQSSSRSELELSRSKFKLGGRDIADGKIAQSFSRSDLELNHSKVKLGDRDIAYGKNAQSFSRSELELSHLKVKLGDRDIANGKKAQSFCRSELDLDTEDLYGDGSEHAEMGNIAGSGGEKKSHIVNIRRSDKCICFECGPVCVCGQTVVSVNPIALSVAKTPWSFGHTECNMVKDTSVLEPDNSINSNKTCLRDNHKALRKAKSPQSFGLSECNTFKDTSVLESDNSIHSNKTCLGDRNSWGETGEAQVPEMVQKPSKHTPQSFGLSECNMVKDTCELESENSINSNKTCLGDRISWGETGEVQVLEMVPKSPKHSVTSLSFCTSRLKEMSDKSSSQLNTSAPPNLHIGLRGYIETPRRTSSFQCENNAVLDSGISNDTLDQSRSSEFSSRSFMDQLTLTKAKAKGEVSPRKFDCLLRSEELLPEKLNYEMIGDCDDIDSVITISSIKTDGTCDVVSLSDSQLGCSYEDKAPKVTRHTPYVHVREKQQAIAASPKRVRFNLTS